MLRSNLKIAWRNLLRDRQFSLLNLLGLSTGIACALLIFLWVHDEKSFDRFHENDGRLYRVMSNNDEPTGIQTSEGAPGPLALALKTEFPEVKDAVIVKPGPGGIVSFENASFKGREQYVTANFLDVFSYKLIEGNSSRVLNNKQHIVISEDMARKMFGGAKNAIGKTVTWNRGDWSGLYTVTGVFETVPRNSSVQFDLLLSYDALFEKYASRLQDWGSSFVNVYVLLEQDARVDLFNEKIRDFVKQHFKANGGDPESLKYIPEIFLQSYAHQYLYNRFENGKEVGGRVQYVSLFSIVATFILLMACINFMNLSTARAAGRSKEVGIKKAMGASKGNLIVRYLMESMMITFVSMIVALGIMYVLLPAFNHITGKQLTVKSFDGNFILLVISIAMLTGLVAGSYPALYLSAVKPLAALKGKIKTSIPELLVRKGLVIFQFTLTVVFIVAVLVIYRQANMIQHKNLGYNKDNIIQFTNEGNLKGKGLKPFIEEIKKIPGVAAASSMRYDLKTPTGFGGLSWPGQRPGQDVQFGNLEVNYDLLELFQYQLKEGRSFSRSFSDEDAKIILNESAVRVMGLNDPIGKSVSVYGKDCQIIGIVKDFHFESLHEHVKPCFFKLTPDSIPVTWNVVVKIRRGMEKQAIDGIEKFYSTYNHGLAFDFRFLDEDYQNVYASENRATVLSRYFAGLAILISCLGLFGLSAFSAQKRQREISIRKVVGATTGDIAKLLTGDFLKLVLIAVLIACPIAWWAMNSWLNDFAYRVDVEVGTFVFAGCTVIFISLFTTGFQAIKSGIANPVKSLRSE